MKKYLLTTIFLATIFFVGCKEKENTNINDASNNDEQAITLRFSWWGSNTRHEATLAAINKYMELNPNIKIEAEYSGWDGYYQKITTQLVGGVAPDIMQLDIPWLPDMVKSDVFLNLYDYDDYMDISDIDEKFLKQSGEYNGKLLSLPTGLNGYVYLYRNELAEKFTISDNMTWETYLNMGKDIHSAYGDAKYLMAGDSNLLIDSVFKRIITQQTGKNLASNNYERQFDEHHVIKAFNIIDQLYKTSSLPPFEDTLSYDNNWIEYPQLIEGNIYSGFILISQISIFQTYTESSNLSVVSLPQLIGSKDSGTWIRPAQMFSISNKTNHPVEAVKFLDFLYNHQEAIKILNTTRSLPVSHKSWEILRNENLLDATTANAANILLKNSGIAQNLADYEPTLNTLTREFIHTIALGKTTAQTAAKDYIELFDKELSRLKRRE